MLDDGNGGHRNNTAILFDNILRKNPKYSRKELLAELRKLLKVDQLTLFPKQPSDFIGHSDGMVRFIDDSTVIINDYSKEKEYLQRSFKLALDNAGLDYVEIPYNPYDNTKTIQANGIYINYLQVGENIIVPKFGKNEDDEVLSIFNEIFPNASIYSINCNEIANEGGVLNCILWNIEE